MADSTTAFGATFVKENRITDRTLSLTLQRWQVLQVTTSVRACCRLELRHGCDSWHVWLGTVTWHFILYLQVVETLALVQCIRIGRSSSVVTAKVTFVRAAWWLLRTRIVVTAIWIISWVAVRIIDEALLFEEVFAAGFARLINLHVILLSEGVVLDVHSRSNAVPLVVIDVFIAHEGVSSVQMLLDHANEAEQLRALDLLWIEIVSFSYIKVRDDVFGSLVDEHVSIKQYVVIELLVAPLFEVIHDGHLGRIELDHQLGRD